MTHILHITHKDEWEIARREGAYRPPTLQAEGFIHFSRPQQVLAVADAFYSGQVGLVLLEVDTGLLAAPLRWEPPDGPALPPGKQPAPAGELFPHLYGALNLEAVVAVHDFPLNGDGRFVLPNTLVTTG